MRWKAVNKKWREYRKDQPKPGYVIRVQEQIVEEHLVGDVNANGGFCDDCDIGPDAVVLAELDLSSLIAEHVSRAKEPK